MDTIKRQYLFAAIFLGMGIYQIIQKDVVEASLYLMAGVSFVLNSVSSLPSLARYKKPLVIVTWVFIFATAVMFLYALQKEYL